MVTQRNIRIVNLSLIEQNMRMIRASVPPHTRVMAVVKADGYGHGAKETAEAAVRGGASMLAVASVKEGAHLRQQGIRTPILVLGPATEADVQEGVSHELIQTVCSEEMVQWCADAASALHKKAEIHLKIDTGMGRIGICCNEELECVIQQLERCSQYVRMTGVFTHFSDADGDEDGMRYTKRQYQRFLEMTGPLPKNILRHCSNSAAIHRFPEMAMDMVRVGISLYGYPPVPTDLQLRPCMKWNAVITYIKTLQAGSYVSYGRTFQTSQPLRVATISCGYGDGYHRAAGKDGYVLIHGRRAKIIGRICMDQMMADISGIDHVKTGDRAVLLGEDGDEAITAEDMASWAGTISYEILLSAGSRVDRIYETNTDE